MLNFGDLDPTRWAFLGAKYLLLDKWAVQDKAADVICGYNSEGAVCKNVEYVAELIGNVAAPDQGNPVGNVANNALEQIGILNQNLDEFNDNIAEVTSVVENLGTQAIWLGFATVGAVVLIAGMYFYTKESNNNNNNNNNTQPKGVEIDNFDIDQEINEDLNFENHI